MKSERSKSTSASSPNARGKSKLRGDAKSQAKQSARARDEDRVAGAMSDEEARSALAASDKLYYRIGEVSQLTAVKAHVLRYWETEFRWMAPPKSRSKQRLYRKRDIELVLLLKRLLWDERYTIAGARQRIHDLGVDDALALLNEPVGSVAATGGDAAAMPSFDPSPFRESLHDVRSRLGSLREELAAPI